MRRQRSREAECASRRPRRRRRGRPPAPHRRSSGRQRCRTSARRRRSGPSDDDLKVIVCSSGSTGAVGSSPRRSVPTIPTGGATVGAGGLRRRLRGRLRPVGGVTSDCTSITSAPAAVTRATGLKTVPHAAPGCRGQKRRSRPRSARTSSAPGSRWRPRCRPAVLADEAVDAAAEQSGRTYDTRRVGAHGQAVGRRGDREVDAVAVAGHRELEVGSRCRRSSGRTRDVGLQVELPTCAAVVDRRLLDALRAAPLEAVAADRVADRALDALRGRRARSRGSARSGRSAAASPRPPARGWSVRRRPAPRADPRAGRKAPIRSWRDGRREVLAEQRLVVDHQRDAGQAPHVVAVLLDADLR